MRPINWTNTVFLILSPLIIIFFLPLHISVHGVPPGLFALFILSCLATSLSITGGYHRYFAHSSYQANKIVKFLYLIFGAAALQGSALKWSSDHRRHHRFVDTEEDPYNAQRGFWYAHIGWVFFKDDPKYKNQMAPDLKSDAMVMWQHNNYIPIAITVGFLTPLLIGWCFNNPWGGLLWGGFARVVITHHSTFFINSLCHMWGAKPYSDKNSARDNFVLAFLTYGEGYHNFHHRFANDYRNGIRWYHWDPTKWLIKVLSYFKFTWNLQKTAEADILKAKLSLQETKLIKSGVYDQRLQSIKIKIEEAQKRLDAFKKKYNEMKSDFSSQQNERILHLKSEIKLAKIELKFALSQWRILSGVR